MDDDKVRVLFEPAALAARDFLRESLATTLTQVVGRCVIEYEGRARSTLPPGDRVVMLKPDGTLLVHTAGKLKPVNWQPPGCVFGAAVENGLLVVTATRARPAETVRIAFESVAAVLACRLDDEAALSLEGSEEELQAALAKVPDVVEPGFTFWNRERDGGRGPMDLYGVDARGQRVVVEVKRRAATVADVEQLRRYVEREKGARGTDVRGILMAPSVSPSAKRYLDDLRLECREIDVAKLLERARTARPAGQRTLGAFGA